MLVPESGGQAGPGNRRVAVMDSVKIEMEQAGRERPRQRQVARVKRIADRRCVVVDIVEKGNKKGARGQRGGEQRPMDSVAPGACGEKRDNRDPDRKSTRLNSSH